MTNVVKFPGKKPDPEVKGPGRLEVKVKALTEGMLGIAYIEKDLAVTRALLKILEQTLISGAVSVTLTSPDVLRYAAYFTSSVNGGKETKERLYQFLYNNLN